ncbi:MAG: hypothetical protein JSU72_02395 [Deltaproteobacteria bacterium]|nr:MAG: hypothetical protein JSU72_02395 [Deltaproteobacteria bacterium]
MKHPGMLKVRLVVSEVRFGAQIMEEVFKEFGVVTNKIFIGAPDATHTFLIQYLGGESSGFLRVESLGITTVTAPSIAYKTL